MWMCILAIALSLTHTHAMVFYGAELTSKALIRSSFVCEADMHIRALANSSGVAGKPTVTIATYNKYQFLVTDT